MKTTDSSQREQNSSNQTPYPNIPWVLESKDTDYRSTGITSSVAIAGHPIHPIIVIFPVAFLVGAAGSDIGYWLTRDPFWARASIWLIGLGFTAGLLAAVIGMFDFINIKRVRKRKAGWAHMYINVAAIVATGINLSLRWGNQEGGVLPTGLIISVIVASLLGLGGWFGGELTFRHKVASIGPASREQAD
ncbi:DUF2231 domain-containing protein [Oculatella sp. LEGE 06141]|uniref:DUF2231 domain-containing protein n=1 Tax=Oculatella sp. LEGE 06141 TaxID=1828648 RepID=UPI001881F053|nr:DUF2231 domain-containing protein [Oculatella sp. LEGE 06141]MBE9179661.1 DUF2231 domain-containing protein [Oculatella sp. LEGE 06141]